MGKIEKAAKVAASLAASVIPGGKVNKRPKHYQQKECPYCKVPVGNLPNHIRLKHSDQAEAEGFTPESTEISKEALLGESKKETHSSGPGVTIYYCTDCRAKLRKNENPCWKCGKQLNWQGID